MLPINITFFGMSDTGLVRSNNEDTFIACRLLDSDRIVLAAIDGMGGHHGGEVAAEIARDSIMQYLTDFPGEDTSVQLRCAIADANNAIIRHQQVIPAYSTMGCVATVALIDLSNQTITVAHVGDSRMYVYFDDKLTKITRDHSFVGFQEDSGLITELEAMHHPRRSVINRCLGRENHMADDPEFIDNAQLPLLPEQTLLLCSDGLSDYVTSDQIAEVLAMRFDAATTCRRLIALANEAGGGDNITVVIAHTSKA